MCSIAFSFGIAPGIVCFSCLSSMNQNRHSNYGTQQNEDDPLHFLSDEERKVVGQNTKAMLAPFIPAIEQLLGQVNGSLAANDPQWQNRICLDEFATRHWYAPTIDRQNVGTCNYLMPSLNQALLDSTLLRAIIDQIDPTLIDWGNYANKHYKEAIQNINKLFFSRTFFANGGFIKDGPTTHLGRVFDPFLAAESQANPRVTPEDSIIPRSLKALMHEYSAQLNGLNKMAPNTICQVTFPVSSTILDQTTIISVEDATVSANQWPRMLAANYALRTANHPCQLKALDYQGRYLKRNENDMLLFSFLSSDEALTGTTSRSTEARLIKNAKALKELRAVLNIPQRIAALEAKKKDLKEAAQEDPGALEHTMLQDLDEQIKELTQKFNAAKGKPFILNKGTETVILKLFSDGSNVKDLLQKVKDEERIVNSQIYTMRMPLYARVFTKENCAQDPKYMFTLLMDPFAPDILKKVCIRNRGRLLETTTVESVNARASTYTDLGGEARSGL